MTNRDWLALSILLGLGAFIWGRDTSWLASAADVLPILVALPAFAWLAFGVRKTPGDTSAVESELPARKLAIGAGLFLGGVIANSTFILSLSWVALLWVWLETHWPTSKSPLLKPLLVLPLLAFPWMTLDFQQVGWWFRLSAAAATARLFAALGYDVLREGTQLHLRGYPISVEAACSGLHTLQSMLIAGAVLAFIYLGETRRYWGNLLLLVPLAWLANTTRIVVLCIATLWRGPQFSMGAFHEWGGLLVLFIMFCLSWAIFAAQRNSQSAGKTVADSPVKAPRRGPDLLPICIAGYAALQSRDLLPAWLHSPFDRLGWLAFLIWVTPVLLLQARSPKADRLACGGAVLLLLAGSVAALNALTYAGFALAISAFLPRDRARIFFLATSVSWMPAFSYFLSRLIPSMVAPAHLIIAAGGTAVFLWLTRKKQPSMPPPLTPRLRVNPAL